MPYIPAVNYSKSGAPNAPEKQVIQISQFSGIDLSSKPTLMSLTRSPDCRNVTRAAPGKIKRRMGYERLSEYEFDGRINGVPGYKPDGIVFAVHAGTKIYYGDQILAGSREEALLAANGGAPVVDTGVADARSCFVRMNTTMWFFDGTVYRGFVQMKDDNNEIVHCAPAVSTNAYVPTVMIDRDPVGGGTAYEDINVLSDAFTELFYADGTSVDYQMSFDELDESAGTTVKIMNNDGLTWTRLTEDTDFSVDYAAGVISFGTAPAVTPVGGQSNVSITISKDRSEKRSRIDKCSIAVCFGDGSTGTRLFCTGNPDYPNRDFWSEIDNPTYFSDLNYSILGGSGSRIVGYSMLGDTLAAHKSDGTIYIRSAVTDSNDMYRQMFPVTSVIRGPKSIAPHSHATLNNEPLFLTENGVHALTSADLTAEKYAQRRSFYLDGGLLKEEDLNQSFALVYKNCYLLAVNSNIYVLDGDTATYAKDEPHSTYQYEGFLWTGINARCLWIWDNVLHFGDENGHIYRFDEALCTDDGEPFVACWETPDLQGGLFHKRRRYTKAALQIGPGSDVDIELQVNCGTDWRTRCTMAFPPGAYARRMVRRLDMNKLNYAALRISCCEDQPFEPDAINIEYIQTGRDDTRL